MKKLIKTEETYIIVKKSKFICNMKYVTSIDEANDFINDIKKKYYDARHNTYAYILKKENDIYTKSSDDREPSGSAGKPMLDILTGAELVNVACVVTRYFGGVLLGVGGLVRAYSDAVKECISKSLIEDIQINDIVEVNLQYNYIGIFQNIIKIYNSLVVDEKYNNDNGITYKVSVPKVNVSSLLNDLKTKSSSQIKANIIKKGLII